MNIAIAGATGVLGKTLVPLLINKGHNVTALVRSPDKALSILPANTSIVKYDLLGEKDDGILYDALNGCDCVMHIATSIPDDASKPGAWDNNSKLRTEGTKKLLDAALISGAKKYIQQSIVMAYPCKGSEWITEEQPLDASPQRADICRPVIQMENLVKNIPVEKLEWTILRGGIFVGPNTFQERTARNIKLGFEIIPNSGNNYLSLIHVNDMAEAFLKAIETNAGGKIFNITDEPLKQRDYIERLSVMLGEGGYIFDHHLPSPPSHRCSNRLARHLLNWSPVEDIFSIKEKLTAK